MAAKQKIQGLITLALWALMLISARAEKGLAVDPTYCLGCHGRTISEARFADSVHGRNGCTSCHLETTNLLKHMQGKAKPEAVNCLSCHSEEAKGYVGSIHQKQGLACVSCHSDIHQILPRKNKKGIITLCGKCHDTTAYQNSVHGKGVAAGNADSPVCTDCHTAHSITTASDRKMTDARKFATASCVRCHSDAAMMKRNGLSTLAVSSYLDSYHGKSYRLGFPERTAGCADCHKGHGVLPSSDPASSVNHKNLAASCGVCHQNGSNLFASFYAHGEHNDRKNYPLLFWTYVGMTGLLVGTFAVFWIHTLLWMFRGFVENREKRALLAAACGGAMAAVEGADVHALHNVPDGNKLYLRFRRRHIFLHLVVIISFLGLSLTGLPLKFSDQQWAKTFMSFYGGVYYAGLIHRACAVLTFYYFTGAIIMSIDYLFIQKNVKGNWLQRLFGPESLMPNLRDIGDVVAMVRWFIFKGPKPTFERWTYWEKFDFLAVFWGMFAIGGSGLMLWFPEFFTKFLPGWVLNIATIVHSDEALLATGFIFTVHFFNTHGRPEKFPMDFVIFNGQISKHEMIEERGDQWRRYEQEGITEQYRAEKPSGVVYDFLFKGFGFLAFFTGLTLAFLMFSAFISR